MSDIKKKLSYKYEHDLDKKEFSTSPRFNDSIYKNSRTMSSKTLALLQRSRAQLDKYNKNRARGAGRAQPPPGADSEEKTSLYKKKEIGENKDEKNSITPVYDISKNSFGTSQALNLQNTTKIYIKKKNSFRNNAFIPTNSPEKKVDIYSQKNSQRSGRFSTEIESKTADQILKKYSVERKSILELKSNYSKLRNLGSCNSSVRAEEEAQDNNSSIIEHSVEKMSNTGTFGQKPDRNGMSRSTLKQTPYYNTQKPEKNHRRVVSSLRDLKNANIPPKTSPFKLNFGTNLPNSLLSLENFENPKEQDLTPRKDLRHTARVRIERAKLKMPPHFEYYPEGDGQSPSEAQTGNNAISLRKKYITEANTDSEQEQPRSNASKVYDSNWREKHKQNISALRSMNSILLGESGSKLGDGFENSSSDNKSKPFSQAELQCPESGSRYHR